MPWERLESAGSVASSDVSNAQRWNSRCYLGGRLKSGHLESSSLGRLALPSECPYLSKALDLNGPGKVAMDCMLA